MDGQLLISVSLKNNECVIMCAKYYVDRPTCIQYTVTFTVTVMILSFWTYRSGQTVQTEIRLLLEEQSDQGIHCLLFHLHHFDKIP